MLLPRQILTSRLLPNTDQRCQPHGILYLNGLGGDVQKPKYDQEILPILFGFASMWCRSQAASIHPPRTSLLTRQYRKAPTTLIFVMSSLLWVRVVVCIGHALRRHIPCLLAFMLCQCLIFNSLSNCFV